MTQVRWGAGCDVLWRSVVACHVSSHRLRVDWWCRNAMRVSQLAVIWIPSALVPMVRGSTTTTTNPRDKSKTQTFTAQAAQGRQFRGHPGPESCLVYAGYPKKVCVLLLSFYEDRRSGFDAGGCTSAFVVDLKSAANMVLETVVAPPRELFLFLSGNSVSGVTPLRASSEGRANRIITRAGLFGGLAAQGIKPEHRFPFFPPGQFSPFALRIFVLCLLRAAHCFWHIARALRISKAKDTNGRHRLSHPTDVLRDTAQPSP